MPACPYCTKDITADFFSEGKFCPFCGNRLPATPATEITFIGKKIGGHYVISEKLGEGGMGYVFRAKHLMLDKDVAIKVLREDFAENTESFERFRREAKNTSKLSHPNAVSMYDFGQTEDGLVYIILEYINGLDLKVLITRDGAFPEERAIPIFLQICEVLEEAHGQGIIHRDLKSENIMICNKNNRQDFVKVLDFGIAKLMDVGGRTTGGTLTQKGVVFGTPQYMSPEQVQGETLDQRADLYSLGIIMYEVVSGDVPFNALNPVDVMVKQVKDKPKQVGKLKDVNISSTLDKIIMKCLEKKPASRFSTARELYDALASIAVDSVDMSLHSLPSSVDYNTSLEDAAAQDKPSKAVGFKLINISGLGSEETPVYKEHPIKIGRHSSNDIVIPQPRVSKLHAEIHYQDNEYVIVDKGSLNGTYVNGRKVMAQVLKDNDLLELSKHQGLKVKFKLAF